MRRRAFRAAVLGALAAACFGSGSGWSREATHLTTSSTIAIANLDAEIARSGSDPGAVEVLLARSRFLADYGALDRAVTLAEPRSATAADLLRRARTRSAAHRFANALVDLDAAERAGADGEDRKSVV